MQYARYSGGQVVFKEGDIGNLYYIILKGSAKVWINMMSTFYGTFAEFFKYVD